MSPSATDESTLELFEVDQDPCPHCGSALTRGQWPLAVDTASGGRIWIPVRPCSGCGRRFAGLVAFLEETQIAGHDPSNLEAFADWRGKLDLRVRRAEEGVVSWKEYRREREERVGGVETTAAKEARPLRLGELRDLPRGRQSWALGWRDEVPVRTDDGVLPETVVLALVVDEEGKVRAREAFPHRPVAADMARLLERAVLEPEDERERTRPRRVFAGEGVDAAAVEDRLGETIYLKDGKQPELVLRLDREEKKGWETEEGAAEAPGTDPGPSAGDDRRKEDARRAREDEVGVPSFLAGEPDEQVRRFHDAAERVLAEEFWSRFEPGSLLGVRLRDRWRYLRLPDPWGGGFSILIFEDWLQVAAFGHNPGDRYAPGIQPDPFVMPAVAVAPIDRIVGRPVEELGGADRSVLKELDISPVPPDWTLAVDRRPSIHELEPPEHDLAFYADLLEVLARVLENRDGDVAALHRPVSLESEDVCLAYPPRGRKALPDVPGVRFVLESGDRDRLYERIEIDAPPETDLEEIVRLVRGIGPQPGFRVRALMKSSTRIYLHELAVSSHPSLPVPVGHLSEEAWLYADVRGSHQPVEVRPLEKEVPEEVEVRIER